VRRYAVTLVLGTVLAFAACGDDSGSSDEERSSIATKPARQILADVVSALRGVRSYHIQGTMTDEDGPATLSGDMSAAGTSRVRFEQSGKRIDLRVLGSTTYMRANSAFWRAQQDGEDARVVKLLSDRWLKTREGDQRDLVDDLLPRSLATCLSTQHGEITKEGTGKVGGAVTVVLHDDGDIPGGVPGDLHVAAKGRPLPLRVTQTGPAKRGKAANPKCDDDGETKASDITLSRFDEPVQITAPPNALDLDALSENGQGAQAT
jgi:hypothetical protein